MEEEREDLDLDVLDVDIDDIDLFDTEEFNVNKKIKIFVSSFIPASISKEEISLDIAEKAAEVAALEKAAKSLKTKNLADSLANTSNGVTEGNSLIKKSMAGLSEKDQSSFSSLKEARKELNKLLTRQNFNNPENSWIIRFTTNDTKFFNLKFSNFKARESLISGLSLKDLGHYIDVQIEYDEDHQILSIKKIEA